MELTDWFPSDLKPVRIGWYDAQFFDCGWSYDWRVWWDGAFWRDNEDGWTLADQQITWRGQTSE